jgi:ribosomal protein S27AE
MRAVVRQQDLADFFEAKKKGIYVCPLCAGHVFYANVSGREPDDSSQAILSVVASRNGDHGFYSLSCGNCGMTTFIHHQQIEDWIAERDKPPDGPPESA